MEKPQSIILVRQRHEADRAGLHYDYRVVIGEKAYSWATKKELDKTNGKLILWEQPIHDRKYALSKKVVIPKGQYGAGTTYLDYVQKGTAKIKHNDYFELNLNNGDRYYIKKMPKYGDKAWLLVNLTDMEKKANTYLEKLANLGSKLKTLSGSRGKLYDMAQDTFKYRASMSKDPELKAKLLNRAERAGLKKSLADKKTAHARRLVPESFVEGAAKAAPGAAIAAISGYLIGRKKEKDVEKAQRVK